MRSHPTTWLHPFLLAAAPVLLLAAHNHDQVRPLLIAAPVLVSLAGAAVLLGIGRLLTSNWQKASLLASLSIVAFFSYGHLHTLLSSFQWTTKTRYFHYGLTPTYLLAIVGGTWLVLRSQGELEKACRVLTTLAAVMCGIALVQLGMHYGPAVDSSDVDVNSVHVAGENPLEQIARRASSRTDLPDIYYIILDGYARGDMLEKYVGFDNSPFLDGLKQRGYYVAEQSASNYMLTYLSLASSLNMRYVHEHVEPQGPTGSNRSPLYPLIWNNRVGRLLKAAGYEYVHLKTNWAGTEHSSIADVSMPRTAPEFYMVLGSTTMLKPILSLAWVPWFSGPTGGRLYHYMFDTIERMPSSTGRPKFVFAHLICPHPPHLVDRHGNVKSRSEVAGDFEIGNMRFWKDLEGYTEQVQFCNKRVLEITDTLLASSSQPPIIIVQADHGSATVLDMSIAGHEQPDLIQERAAILNVFLVPESIRNQLYPSITPVNTFRIVLSELLDLDLELLDERIYFSWYDAPHNFIDVTDVVRSEDPTSVADPP